MSTGVAIASPASPRALAPLLSGSDRELALTLPGLGGTPVNNLAAALVESGADVEVVTLAREVADQVVLEGDRFRLLIAPYRDRARSRTADLFREERRGVERLLADTSASVVHARWTYEFALGAFQSRKRPVVVTADDAPLTVLRYSPDLYRVGRTALAIWTRMRLTHLSTNSPHLAGAWRRQMGYRKPIRVIPNAIPAPPGSANSMAKGGPLTILDVTNADRLKNVASLLRAMKHVLRVQPEARCRLVGPGLDAASPLAGLAAGLGVGHAVEFVGPIGQEQVRAEYERASIFVHSSLEEAFGMSVAEAMSHGLPVVGGARAGAVPWVLGEGESGLLVDMRHPRQIADAVCELAADRAMRTELGTRARQRALSTFSPQTVAAAAAQMYDDARSGRI